MNFNVFNLQKEYRYLGFLMGLPLIDGVFLSIVLTGGLNSIYDALVMGMFVIGGGATIGVIVTEFDGELLTTLKRCLIVGLIISLIAVLQAAFAPVIEPFINTSRFKIGAIIALIALAIKILPIDKFHSFIINPSIIIVITMVLSIRPTTDIILMSPGIKTAYYAFLASLVAITISICAVLLRPYLIEKVNVASLQIGTSIGLIAIAISLVETIPSVVSNILFISAIINVLVLTRLDKYRSSELKNIKNIKT